MKNQRICIIGDGLSGLTSTIAINNVKNIDVHLISKKLVKNIDKRTTAISENNFKFLKKNISNLSSKSFWPSKDIKLFFNTYGEKINFLNFKEKKNNLMYVCENNKLKKILLNEIKKKKIKITRKKIEDLNELRNYDLIILCLGGSSQIYDKIINSRSIRKNYNEVAVTGHVKHNINGIKTSQYFLKEGPLAILPFSKNHFSFVWSLDKNYYQNNAKIIRNLIKNKIQNLLSLKNNIQIKNIQNYPIKMKLQSKYHKKNILILGEGLHTIHPVAGQGFNLALRDIKKLKEILTYYSRLGISINNSYALEDFSNYRKPENIIMGLGIDATHRFFKQNKYLDPMKKIILRSIIKNDIVKKLSKIISNQGLSF